MSDEGIRIVILSVSVLFSFITGFIIYFVVLYRNRQLKNKQEQEELQAAFRQELLKTQLEVQEQTLNYISSEIHDNITQVLSFVKLTLATLNKSSEEKRQSKIEESRELISQTITDLRDLSKSLSYDFITTNGLVETIKKEVEKITKSGLLEVVFDVNGETYSMGEQRELVLFRIFQETLNNTLKHSGARHLKIELQYQADSFNLTLADDGAGFSTETLDNKLGSGLKNIENRATLIGGMATIVSSPDKGCTVNITLDPLKLQFNPDGGTYPDRTR